MGYQTTLDGAFSVTPAVTKTFMDFINRFAETRRMMRDPKIVQDMDADWAQHCFNGHLGEQAGYYVPPRTLKASWLKADARPANRQADIPNPYGDVRDKSVISGNRPPAGQPNSWCQWCMPTHTTLAWDGAEKFYDYAEWLGYLITHFFRPSGYVVNGDVCWQGEDHKDRGILSVTNNAVDVQYGK